MAAIGPDAPRRYAGRQSRHQQSVPAGPLTGRLWCRLGTYATDDSQAAKPDAKQEKAAEGKKHASQNSRAITLRA